MIVKMDKYAFLVYHKEYDAFLARLRDLGVVHVMRSKPTKDHPAIQRLAAEEKRVQAQLDFFDSIRKADAEKRKKEAKGAGSSEVESPIPQKTLSRKEKEELLGKAEALREDLAKSNSSLASMNKEREAFSVWGDFSYENIKRLRGAGYEVTFFSCPEARFDEAWAADYNAIVVEKRQSVCFFVTITPVGEAIAIDADRAKLPAKDLAHINADLAEETKRKEKIERALSEMAHNGYDSLKSLKREVENESEWNAVLAQTGHEADDKLMLLEGWIPDGKAAAMEKDLQSGGAYFEQLDITPEDDIPILLKNNWFARLFEPIGDLYMLPKYNELDLTPYFAPFFMIFFGLCLGDIGYGLLLLLGATCARLFMKNLSRSMRAITALVQVLGASTMVCGLLTGTFFGFNIYDWGVPQLEWCKTHLTLDNSQMFSLSLILGCIQIIFGMVLKAINRAIQFGFAYALSTIGWIVFLLSIAFAYLFPSVMPMFGTVHIAIMCVAGFLIMFVNSPGKNPFMNFGLGLWDAYNMATGLLGDVLSYVRLFALGLSGGILAGVFNSLASNMSPENVILGPVVTVIIFVAGHTMNIFMNVLGAIVHPMRLTFVEFYKNSEFTGGGERYAPFGRK